MRRIRLPRQAPPQLGTRYIPMRPPFRHIDAALNVKLWFGPCSPHPPAGLGSAAEVRIKRPRVLSAALPTLGRSSAAGPVASHPECRLSGLVVIIGSARVFEAG